ncbi:MAG: site-specific integrase, partial [Bacteroidetes bacterium]|nr:site-specific integrase [Bacteroidota bacterium]
MINNLSIRFYLNEYKPQGKKYPIYFRITVNRKKSELATSYHIEPKEWSETSQRTKKNSQINEDLASMEEQVYNIAKYLKKKNKAITSLNIKDILTEKYKVNTHLIEFFNRFTDRLALAGESKNENISYYGVTKKHLQNFLQERKIHDVLIENIDYNFISDFDLFLLSQKVNHSENTMMRNTANKHHSRVRTILLRAIKEGHIHKNPYMDFKLNKTPSTRTFLTDEELEQITEHTLGGNESLMKVRDIFIFSVYTGLRFEDAQLLTMDSITKEKKGKHSLRIKQEKTDEYLAIPLLKPALSIISKYENSPE